MDDVLEEPSASVLPVASSNGNEYHGEQQPSDDEEDAPPDWTRFPTIAHYSASSSASKSATSIARPVIPKRGEKEFEPLVKTLDEAREGNSVDTGAFLSTSGSSLQQHKLESIRAAMFSALEIERRINSKALMHAIWRRPAARARVLIARGNQLVSMGHSAPRCDDNGTDVLSDGSTKGKRVERVTELLPEEALYLVERGSMLCWTQLDNVGDEKEAMNGDLLEGTPMSLQQAYAIMIGREDLTLERYQVYAYLRRLGYVVIRAQPPSHYYPTSSPYTKPSPTKARASIFSRLFRFLSAPFRWLFGPNSATDWWSPLRTGFPHRFSSYSSIFQALRFIPSGHDLPLHRSDSAYDIAHFERKESLYRIFFNVYKPSTPFRKTAPPPPDFYVVVVDARTTPMPSLQELSHLFEHIPPSPPPLPRRRAAPLTSSENRTKSDDTSKSRIAENRSSTSNQQPSTTSTPSVAPSSAPASLTLANITWTFLRLLFKPPFLRRWRRGDAEKDVEQAPRPHVHPFAALKAGRRSVVIAAVDSGTISFFRFAEGAFDEWPMV